MQLLLPCFVVCLSQAHCIRKRKSCGSVFITICAGCRTGMGIKMFKNIGGKIKGLAKVICYVGIAISVIAGIFMIGFGSSSYNGDTMIVMGCVIMIVGSLVSWIGSFFAYGFGELIENTTVIAELAAKADAEKNKAE